MPDSQTFHSKVQGKTLIVMPSGSVSSLAGQYFKPELDDLLGRLNRPELKNVVLDLANVSYFGTIMLGTMHQLWKSVRDGGGKMALCNVSTVGREILRVSGVDTIWPVYSSPKEALDAVEEEEPGP